jgi:hypothetical protein
MHKWWSLLDTLTGIAGTAIITATAASLRPKA